MTAPVPRGFDELIHAPTRLSFMALLAASAWADFRFARDSLGLSDSALSKQISTLERAGYVVVEKTGAGRRGRTYVRISERGREAFDAHVVALRTIVDTPGAPSDQE